MSHISLNKLYKEIKKDIINEINSVIPYSISLIQENFINNIQINDYFTVEEKQVLSLYFTYNSVINEENVINFSKGLLNEGVADWIGSAWDKVKGAFNNIKNFVVKIWTSIKTFVISQCNKAFGWAKSKFNSLKPKITKAILDIKDKAQLAKEILHADEIYDWLKANTVKFFDKYGVKAEDELESGTTAEAIFDSRFTTLLLEQPEAIPTDITKPETISTWKKLGIGAEKVLKVLSVVFNPLKALVIALAKTTAPYLLTKFGELIEKIGGPKAIPYIVLPTALVSVSEIFGAFHGIDGLFKGALDLIPGIGQFISPILEIGHYIFFALALFEIIHEVSQETKTAQPA